MCHTSAPPPSSTLTTLRALFMLACLVAIPAVALRGTSLGGILRRFLVEKLDKPAERSSARADLEDAPPFVSPATGLSSPTTSPPVGGYDPSANAIGRLPGLAATARQEDAAPWGPPPGISAPRANDRPPEAPLSASWRGTSNWRPGRRNPAECVGRSPRAERSGRCGRVHGSVQRGSGGCPGGRKLAASGVRTAPRLELGPRARGRNGRRQGQPGGRPVHVYSAAFAGIGSELLPAGELGRPGRVLPFPLPSGRGWQCRLYQAL